MTPYNANEIIEEMSEESSFYMSPIKRQKPRKRVSPIKAYPVKPYLKQLMRDIINSDLIYFLSDFLTTAEVIELQRVNHLFKNSLRVYLPTRLQQEADYINLFIEENEPAN